MAVVPTAEDGRLAVPEPPPSEAKMHKTSSVKVRMPPNQLKQWRTEAGGRHLSLSALIVESVEASIVGKVDHVTLDQHLRRIRSAINAATEAKSMEEARTWLAIAKGHLTDLRGL